MTYILSMHVCMYTSMNPSVCLFTGEACVSEDWGRSWWMPQVFRVIDDPLPKCSAPHLGSVPRKRDWAQATCSSFKTLFPSRGNNLWLGMADLPPRVSSIFLSRVSTASSKLDLRLVKTFFFPFRMKCKTNFTITKIKRKEKNMINYLLQLRDKFAQIVT